MAKSLYSALFDWIVFRTNHALLNNRDLEDNSKVGMKTLSKTSHLFTYRITPTLSVHRYFLALKLNFFSLSKLYETSNINNILASC